MKENLIYLDTYVLQQDMRIRLPKAVLENMGLEKGKSMLNIFYNNSDNSIILRVGDTHETSNKK